METNRSNEQQDAAISCRWTAHTLERQSRQPADLRRSPVQERKTQMLNPKPTISLNVLIAILLTICNGCGYVSSGEWTDDNGNWDRAFGEPVPDGVTVDNSWYMRTAHWTAEYAWFFKLRLDANKRQLAESDADFEKLQSEDAVRAVQQTYSDRPTWFPMDDLDRYDVYQSKSRPDFLMLLERDGVHSYWTACEL